MWSPQWGAPKIWLSQESKTKSSVSCIAEEGKKQLIPHEAERVWYHTSQITLEASGNFHIASLSVVYYYGQKTPPNVSFHPAVVIISLPDLESQDYREKEKKEIGHRGHTGKTDREI